MSDIGKPVKACLYYTSNTTRCGGDIVNNTTSSVNNKSSSRRSGENTKSSGRGFGENTKYSGRGFGENTKSRSVSDGDKITLDFDKTKFKKISSKRHREEVKLFTRMPKEGEYLFDKKKMIGYIPDPDKSEAQKKHYERYVENGLSVPLVVDTEFTTSGDPLNPQSRTHITTQIKGIADNAPAKIYTDHSEILKIPQIGARPIEFEFHPLQYVKDLGYKVSDLQSCKPWEAQNLKPLTFSLYAHMALAELLMVSHGDFQKDTLEKVKVRQIQMGRRLYASTTVSDGRTRDFVDYDWKVKIEGEWYKIRIRWIDSIALHGVAKYEQLGEATGVELPHKSILKGLVNKKTGEPLGMDEILTIAKQYPVKFRLYALGDLKVYDILKANKELMQKLYQELGLTMKNDPKLTIGGTVKDLFKASLDNWLNQGKNDDDKRDVGELIDRFISVASAQNLKTNYRDTKALLAKVEGGRCRNNRPTMVNMEGIVVDIDINGCYGEGQRNQIYPVGNPVIHSYPINTTQNKYMNLEKWLKIMKWGKDDCELVPGVWQARISSIGKLKYPQDLFASWTHEGGTGVDILAKYVAKEMKNDSENIENEEVFLNTDDGGLKIFEHEIHNGVLTHDGLEWILNIASQRQRKEMLSKIVVLSSMHYPASERLENIEELFQHYDQWDGKNESFYNNKNHKTTQVTHECHKWIGINLGTLLIDKLLENRGLAKINFGDKCPLQTMYKLNVNTLFGDMVSKYFKVSNTCVGNNITARARTLCWLMEKGLYGIQSITDGCAFNPNKVLFHGSEKINGECTSLHRKELKIKRGKWRRNKLGGRKWSGDENGVYADGELVGKGAKNPLIAKLAMKHLQQLFPGMSVLHAQTQEIQIKDGLPTRVPRTGQFGFEVKDCYKSMVAHGTANYRLEDFKGNVVLKARGYEGKAKHITLNTDGEVIDRYSDKTPIGDLLSQLQTNPDRVVRQQVAIKTGILKPSEYLESQKRYDALKLMPGDNRTKSFLTGEFSMTQFTFKTHEQYATWKKQIEKLKKKTGQSIEAFFLNQDGSLNYTLMIQTIDRMIEEDVLEPVKYLDPTRHRDRKGNHPAKKALDDFRNRDFTVSKIDDVEVASTVIDPPQNDIDINTHVEEKELTDGLIEPMITDACIENDEFDAVFGFS
ncbi:MAG: hypothetical protein F6J89_13705 [Symploca sp. SIO1C4]|uniref:DNA-directed DNA polymerase n=1 Tax=Symploca sp. SIO1C4 TaxID=2607765 RepID=A0A6B3NAP1_9CYAN|nr:hypothetical protein [Symploca sp. SIO1C4]